MIRAIVMVLFFLIISHSLIAQSFSRERISRLKNATVRISIDSVPSVGTAFFISNEGRLLTCLHVVMLAINEKGKQVRKIFVETNRREVLEYRIPSEILDDKGFMLAAMAFDFIPLDPVVPAQRTYEVIKIGSFGNANEGDEIYTVGYPIGIRQQFLSKGIISTIYRDSVFVPVSPGHTVVAQREVALLDLTLNAGNSGGAILKVGATPQDDQIVGYADFNVIPFGPTMGELANYIGSLPDGAGILGLSVKQIFGMFASALSQASIGVAGMVPIDFYFKAMEDHIKRKGIR